jgi:predicted amidohydrolase YtcJ
VGDAVLVEAGAVVAVGWRSELALPGRPEHHHAGATIVPGLVDSHTHPVAIATTEAGVDVHDAADLTDLLDRLAMADGPTVVGHRLDEHRLGGGHLPSRSDLDRLDRPVVLHRVCGHLAVVNTAALEAAGIDPTTPEPPGGSIDRDADGMPTGVLRDEAIRLLGTLGGVTGPGPDRLVATLRRLRAEGLTRLGAILAPAGDLWSGTGDEVAAALEVGSDLPIPLHVLVATTDRATLEHSAEAIHDAHSPMLRWAGLKLFSDGSFGGATAALRDGRGLGRLVPARDMDLARTALDLGGSVAIHAIGDAALDTSLDLCERLLDAGADPSRLRVEHVSLAPDDAIDRLVRLGVVASIQPAFVASDGPWLAGLLGERVRDAYRFGSLARAGAAVAGGSDCPVDPASPLWGMRWARERDGFGDTEAVDGATALAWWTDGAHHALGLPPPLSVGAPADLTVLTGDPVDTPPASLGGLGVTATWVGGMPT